MLKTFVWSKESKLPFECHRGKKQQQQKQEIRWWGINSWSFRGSVMGVSRLGPGGSLTSGVGRTWSAEHDLLDMQALLKTVSMALTRKLAGNWRRQMCRCRALNICNCTTTLSLGRSGIIPEQQYGQREEYEKQPATFPSICRNQRQNVACFYELICANKASSVSCCKKY